MTQELELEAEKVYPKNPFWIGSGDSARLYDEFKSQRDAYIAGATSKYVEKQKLEFAIDILYILRCSPSSEIDIKIEELEQKLKELL